MGEFFISMAKKKKLRNSHAENPFLNYVQYKVMFEVPVRRLLSNSKFLQPGLCKVKKKKKNAFKQAVLGARLP